MQSFVKFCPPKEKKMQMQGAYGDLEIWAWEAQV